MKKIKFKIFRSPGIVLGIVLLGLAAYLLGWSTLLSAKSLDIHGTKRTQEIEEVISHLPASAYRPKAPLARVDVHYISRKLAQLDWVKDEKVSRDWLHGRIKIEIAERTPVAQFINDQGTLSLIDKSGITFISPTPVAHYPTITFGSTEPSLKVAIATFLQELPEEWTSNLQALTIREPIYIQSAHSGMGSGKLIIRWGDGSEMATKVKVIRTLLALKENKTAKLIDVISPLAPIVK